MAKGRPEVLGRSQEGSGKVIRPLQKFAAEDSLGIHFLIKVNGPAWWNATQYKATPGSVAILAQGVNIKIQTPVSGCARSQETLTV